MNGELSLTLKIGDSSFTVHGLSAADLIDILKEWQKQGY